MTTEEKRTAIERLTPEQKAEILKEARLENSPWTKDEHGVTNAVNDYVKTKTDETGLHGLGGKKI